MNELNRIKIIFGESESLVNLGLCHVTKNFKYIDITVILYFVQSKNEITHDYTYSQHTVNNYFKPTNNQSICFTMPGRYFGSFASEHSVIARHSTVYTISQTQHRKCYIQSASYK